MTMTGRAKWTVIGIMCAAIVALPRARGEVNINIPIDKELSEVTTTLTLMGTVASGGLAPVTFFLGESLRQFAQAGLWRIAMDADAAVMQAWTIESLLNIDRQLHGSVAVVETLLKKLPEDQKVLQDRARGAFRAGASESDKDRVETEARLEAITRVLEDLRKPPFADLPARGQSLFDEFEAIRKMVVNGGVYPGQKLNQKPANSTSGQSGGVVDAVTNDVVGKDRMPPPLVSSYFTPDTLLKNWQLAAHLVEYMTVAAQLESRLLTPRKTPVTIDGRMAERDVMPSAMRHLRLLVVNQSADLVYFIRVNSKDASGTNLLLQGSSGSARWLAIYPEGATTEIDKPTRPADQVEAGAGVPGPPKVELMQLQLPSSVWLPVGPGDELEVRVATYGPERQKIRWLPLRAKLAQLRPEISTGGGGGTSITRGFYYLGFTLAYDMLGRTTVRHFSTKETYAWALTGLWEGHVEYPVTRHNDLREVAEAKFPLTLNNDHIKWTLPADFDAIVEAIKLKKTPDLKATVTGQADIAYRTSRILGPNVGDRVEHGKGDLLITIQIW